MSMKVLGKRAPLLLRFKRLSFDSSACEILFIFSHSVPAQMAES